MTETSIRIEYIVFYFIPANFKKKISAYRIGKELPQANIKKS